MISNILRWCFVPIVISFAALVSLSAEAQDNIPIKKVSTAALPGSIFAILVQTLEDTGLPQRTTDIFAKLLQAPLQQTRPPLAASATQPAQRSAETLKPKAMTMLSISCYEQGHTQATQALLIRCRTEGHISDARGGGRFVMRGVITEDVVSAGKILIAAGSKVAGIGHIDPDTGRVESKGHWSIIANNRELRVHAEVRDADTGFHGIEGQETSFESEGAQRQAVVRDGRYCFVADKTPFVLSIAGEVKITVLESLQFSE